MGWLDNVLNVNRVQQSNGGEVSRVAFTGGEEEQSTSKGWEKYHTGQGPNGLKAFPDEYSGKLFNTYM